MSEKCQMCGTKIKAKGHSPIGFTIYLMGFCSLFCINKKCYTLEDVIRLTEEGYELR